MNSFIKNVLVRPAAIAGLIIGLSCAPMIAQASTLTTPQIDALIGLLRAFNVDEATISIVEAQLTPVVGNAVIPTDPAGATVPVSGSTNKSTSPGTSTPAAAAAATPGDTTPPDVWTRTLSDQGYTNSTSTLVVVTDEPIQSGELYIDGTLDPVGLRWDRQNSLQASCVYLYDTTPRRLMCNGYRNDLTIFSNVSASHMRVRLYDAAYNHTDISLGDIH